MSKTLQSTALPASPTALAGVRVLDLSRVLAGPWATQTLGDLGAEVLKIEKPGVGDDTRSWGPPFLTDESGAQSDAAYYTCANRNKASITLDFTTPEGSEILRALIPHHDVLVENFKTGGLAKYGLDYDSVAKINPKMVYCSITGFGQTGPYAPRAGYDYLVQAAGGLMSVTGQADGTPGAEPLKVGVAVADLFTGLYATIAILAALRHAEATGQGQHIDMALLDCQTAVLPSAWAMPIPISHHTKFSRVLTGILCWRLAMMASGNNFVRRQVNPNSAQTLDTRPMLSALPIGII
jgi:crotonobetainyl-CoA:carnitine CoA-transferase CaiB-like acyl-CoA transferase